MTGAMLQVPINPRGSVLDACTFWTLFDPFLTPFGDSAYFPHLNRVHTVLGPGQHHRVTGPGRDQTGHVTSYCPMYTQCAHLREGPRPRLGPNWTQSGPVPTFLT